MSNRALTEQCRTVDCSYVKHLLFGIALVAAYVLTGCAAA
jgi:hypothetical protein